MFRSLECDSITVPSCPAHNNKKSGRDRGILIALIICIQQGLEGGFYKSPTSPLVITAIKDLIRDYPHTVNEVRLLPLIMNGPEKFRIDLPYVTPIVNLKEWIFQLTAALVWSVTGYHEHPIVWEEARAWSPSWVGTDNPQAITIQDAARLFKEIETTRSAYEKYAWQLGWSRSPRAYPSEIFRFSFSISPHGKDPNATVIFKLVFYDQIDWFVFFIPRQATVDKLILLSI